MVVYVIRMKSLDFREASRRNPKEHYSPVFHTLLLYSNVFIDIAGIAVMLVCLYQINVIMGCLKKLNCMSSFWFHLVFKRGMTSELGLQCRWRFHFHFVTTYSLSTSINVDASANSIRDWNSEHPFLLISPKGRCRSEHVRV